MLIVSLSSNAFGIRSFERTFLIPFLPYVIYKFPFVVWKVPLTVKLSFALILQLVKNAQAETNEREKKKIKEYKEKYM